MSKIEQKTQGLDHMELADDPKKHTSDYAQQNHADIYMEALEKYGADGSIPADAEKRLKRFVRFLVV